MKLVQTAAEAVSYIGSGQRVFVHGEAATPHLLLDALFERCGSLKDVELVHLHLMDHVPYDEAAFKKSFRVANFFVGKNVRDSLDYDTIDYLPCFLSEIPYLFRSKRRPLDVALIHVSSPDHHGFCTLGVSVDIAKAAVECASLVIAQINPQMPRMHGDGFIHVSDIDYGVEVDTPLSVLESHSISDVESKIGENVATLIEDGATLQIGIGAVPDAVLLSLKDRKHLGIHSEMWSDGALALIEAGVIDNSQKVVHPGKSVSGFLMGTRRLYDYVHDNPSVIQLDIGYVNSPTIIARNPKVVAINSAVEVDLSGQICADSLGSRIISGVGGQMDFMRGASLSHGGKPVIALSSRTHKGIPRIVSQLKLGAGVVTTRAHAHYVVTEYGVIDLFGKTLKERAQALIT
ncbi:MAG: Succinyl-CoA:coenzyme A transferase, partial [Chlamydiae bacterium]|nr:Succinyl-CoA:coenzyme A transferase [Chlamydiota bacterium]